MNSNPYQPQWFSMVPPNPPMSSGFWDSTNVQGRLKDLQETFSLANAMKKELEMFMLIKNCKESSEDTDNFSPNDATICGFLKLLEERGIDPESQVPLSVESANSLMAQLRFQIEPFRAVTDEMCPWEEKSAVVRLSDKMRKLKRNKLWRKRKRKRVAEMLAKERERFEQADQEADEWRVREIAKDIAKRKVEKMKEIAKVKAKEERNKLESELELVLIVEKLQELRSMRIDKLKKQGHFLPEEDDKFLERVQAAVEEEELQAIAAADTEAAKDAIATAIESRKTIISNPRPKDVENKDDDNSREPVEKKDVETQGYCSSGAYDLVGNLPVEMYHYYHGSNNDIGTLIEVRRTWDSYIRLGGSRIPGHWVRPPPPANETWASYLVRPKYPM